MRKKYFMFIINGVVSGAPDRLTVIGRCGDLPIRIGDKFERIYRHMPRELPSDAARAPIRETEKELSLRVVCVHAYDRSLPELGEGMTGSLVLDGDGMDLLIPGWILGTIDDESPRNPYPINPAEQTVVV